MYIGRFAPTPSGPLHFGSLITALASYLQARTQHGMWFIRMEDTDVQRNRIGADQDILTTLESFGFEWDNTISYQSQRSTYYESALSELHKHNHCYYCDCTRKRIATAQALQGEFGIIYDSLCESRNLCRSQHTAIRLRVPDTAIAFTDAIFGRYEQNLKRQLGDFHLVRRDQCYAYQLAVVVDDALQGVTEVVRGYDILDSTPRQLHLQTCLGYHQPDYVHVPLAVDSQGNKLSKHTFAPAISSKEARYLLLAALRFLGQQPEAALQTATMKEIWEWAMHYWSIDAIPRQKHITHT